MLCLSGRPTQPVLPAELERIALSLNTRQAVGLCVGAEGAPTQPFLFFFECSPQVGWAQNTLKNFPPLGCFLSCSVSPVWREVSRTVGGGGKTERNIVQGLAVWAVQKEAVY